MLRRDFVRLAGGAALGAFASPILGPIWAARADGPPKRMIVVMLRGAVDGLNVVVPYGEAAYYDARPTIAIQKPGTRRWRAGAGRAFRPASGARSR